MVNSLWTQNSAILNKSICDKETLNMIIYQICSVSMRKLPIVQIPSHPQNGLDAVVAVVQQATEHEGTAGRDEQLKSVHIADTAMPMCV